MKIQITVEMMTDNPAFGEDEGSRRTEMARLLADATRQLGAGASEGSWFDGEGEPVGVWWLDAEEEVEPLSEDEREELAEAIVAQMGEAELAAYVIEEEMARLESMAPHEQHALWDDYFEAEEAADERNA